MSAPDLRSDETKYNDDRVNKAIAAERERCAQTAEAEPELPGDMPAELHIVPIEDALRATVRATKKSIAAAIRAGR
jgi:hypothetical protein